MTFEDPSVPTNKPKITFICEENTRASLEEWAEEEGRSLSNLVERIVRTAIKDRQQNSTDPAKQGGDRRD